MRRLVRAALADIMPSGGPMPGLDDVDWETFVEQFKREAPPSVWAGVCAGAVVYTVSPILTVHRPVLSFQLSDELRDTHASRITDHHIYLVRQAMFVLKLAGGFAWGADPEVRRRLNLEPYMGDPEGYHR